MRFVQSLCTLSCWETNKNNKFQSVCFCYRCCLSYHKNWKSKTVVLMNPTGKAFFKSKKKMKSGVVWFSVDTCSGLAFSVCSQIGACRDTRRGDTVWSAPPVNTIGVVSIDDRHCNPIYSYDRLRIRAGATRHDERVDHKGCCFSWEWSMVSAQILVLDCCSHMPFLRRVSMTMGSITFLWHAVISPRSYLIDGNQSIKGYQNGGFCLLASM